MWNLDGSIKPGNKEKLSMSANGSVKPKRKYKLTFKKIKRVNP